MSEHEQFIDLVKRASKFLGKEYIEVANMTVIDVVAELVQVCETQGTLLDLWVKDDED